MTAPSGGPEGTRTTDRSEGRSCGRTRPSARNTVIGFASGIKVATTNGSSLRTLFGPHTRPSARSPVTGASRGTENF